MNRNNSSAGANDENDTQQRRWPNSDTFELGRRTLLATVGVASVGAMSVSGTAAAEAPSEDGLTIQNDHLETYANQAGRVSTDGVDQAFEDYGNGEIDIDQLDDVIDAWNEAERVVDYEVRQLGNITEDTTLQRAPDGDPVVYTDSGFTVDVDATLEIEPGVAIEFSEGTGMSVNSDGIIMAQGTADEPILFTGTNPVRGWWDGVYVRSDAIDNEMDHCIVEYGGDGYGANVRSDSGGFDFRNCRIRRSGEYGIKLDGNSAQIRDTENNTYKNNVTAAFTRFPNADGFDSSSEFIDNDNPYVFVRERGGSSDFTDLGEFTWDSLDIPYRLRVADVFGVDGGTWTIEPGTTIECEEDVRIGITGSGTVDWRGEAPETEIDWITFTGVQEYRGWWDGMRIRSDSENNALEYVTVEYAGDPDGLGANIAATSGGAWDFRHCRIRHSGKYGIKLDSNSAQIRDAENNTYENNVIPAFARFPNADGFDSSSEFIDNDNPYLFVRERGGSSDFTDLGEFTWENLDVPYRLRVADVFAIDGGTWTIEPGTTIECEEDVRIGITGSGVADWRGEAPVTEIEVLESSSGSIDLEDPIASNQGAFDVTVTELSVADDANPCLFIFKNDEQEESFQPVEEGESLIVDADDVGGLESGDEITATLYEWDCFEGALTSESTTVDGDDDDGLDALFQWDPSDPEVGEEITFDASDSSAPDGEIVESRWDFTGDGTVDEETADSMTTYTYDDSDDYAVELTVEDEDGQTDEFTRTVSVQDVPGWITFTGVQKDRGWWDGISIRSDSENNALEYVTVEYAGDPNGLGANIRTTSGGAWDFRHCRIRHSGEYGIKLDSNSAQIRDAENNTYENNVIPAFARFPNADGFDSSSEFIDNDNPYVFVRERGGSSDFTDLGEFTWDGLDVPYRLRGGDRFGIDGGTWTIEPGAVLEMEQGSDIRTSSADDVTLNFVGTEDEEIVFTGTDETPGWWDGIRVRSESLLNEIKHATIEYGGRPNDFEDPDPYRANVAVMGLLEMTDCTLRESGWNGAYTSSSVNSEICDENTFENNENQDCIVDD